MSDIGFSKWVGGLITALQYDWILINMIMVRRKLLISVCRFLHVWSVAAFTKCFKVPWQLILQNHSVFCYAVFFVLFY